MLVELEVLIEYEENALYWRDAVEAIKELPGIVAVEATARRPLTCPACWHGAHTGQCVRAIGLSRCPCVVDEEPRRGFTAAHCWTEWETGTCQHE